MSRIATAAAAITARPGSSQTVSSDLFIISACDPKADHKLKI